MSVVRVKKKVRGVFVLSVDSDLIRWLLNNVSMWLQWNDVIIFWLKNHELTKCQRQCLGILPSPDSMVKPLSEAYSCLQAWQLPLFFGMLQSTGKKRLCRGYGVFAEAKFCGMSLVRCTSFSSKHRRVFPSALRGSAMAVRVLCLHGWRTNPSFMEAWHFGNITESQTDIYIYL